MGIWDIRDIIFVLALLSLNSSPSLDLFRTGFFFKKMGHWHWLGGSNTEMAADH